MDERYKMISCMDGSSIVLDKVAMADYFKNSADIIKAIELYGNVTVELYGKYFMIFKHNDDV